MFFFTESEVDQSVFLFQCKSSLFTIFMVFYVYDDAYQMSLREKLSWCVNMDVDKPSNALIASPFLARLSSSITVIEMGQW